MGPHADGRGSPPETGPSRTRLAGVGRLPALVVLLGLAVVGTGVAGRLTAPDPTLAPSPSTGPIATPAPATPDPSVGPAGPAVALIGIDLPPAIASYRASEVLATLRVFGRLTGPTERVVAQLRDESPPLDLGSATASIDADGRFSTDLAFLPPVGGGRVVLELRDAGGAVLATVPYVVRVRGAILFRSPDRLVGWQAGETVNVVAVVRHPGPIAAVRLRTQDDRILEERWVTTGPDDAGWRSVAARLVIPDGLPLGRAWLEVAVPGRGEEPETAARLLLRAHGR